MTTSAEVLGKDQTAVIQATLGKLSTEQLISLLAVDQRKALKNQLESFTLTPSEIQQNKDIAKKNIQEAVGLLEECGYKIAVKFAEDGMLIGWKVKGAKKDTKDLLPLQQDEFESKILPALPLSFKSKDIKLEMQKQGIDKKSQPLMIKYSKAPATAPFTSTGQGAGKIYTKKAAKKK